MSDSNIPSSQIIEWDFPAVIRSSGWMLLLLAAAAVFPGSLSRVDPKTAADPRGWSPTPARGSRFPPTVQYDVHIRANLALQQHLLRTSVSHGTLISRSRATRLLEVGTAYRVGFRERTTARRPPWPNGRQKTWEMKGPLIAHDARVAEYRPWLKPVARKREVCEM